jgi:hypothetical protein
MKARSVVVGVLVAGAMLLAAQVSASANVAWCLSDPPVQVLSPGGNYLMVNTQVYLPPYATHLKSEIYDSAVATPDSNGGTLITVYVFVPAPAHVVASVNRWQASATTAGSGTVTLYLDVPIT